LNSDPFWFFATRFVSVLPRSNMHVHAYDIALLLFLLPCVSASRVRLAGVKDGDEELFTPLGGLRPAIRPVHHAAHAPQTGPNPVVPAVRLPRTLQQQEAFSDGFLLGRREWLASAAGGTAVLLGMPAPNVAAEMQEQATELDSKKLLDANPGLVILGVAEIAAFQEQLCRSTAAGENGEDALVNLRKKIAFDTKRLLQGSHVDQNLARLLQNVEKDKYDEAKVAANEAIDMLVKILGAAADTTFFGTKSELLRFADQYKGSRENLLFVFSALPTEEQDRLYGLAKTLPFAKEYEELIGKLART